MPQLMKATAFVGYDPRHKRIIDATLDKLKKGAPRALAFATTDALRKGKTMVKNAVLGELELSSTRVGREISHRKTSPKSGMISVKSGKALSLTTFKGAKQIKSGDERGVHVKVRKRETTEIHHHAFIARGRAGRGGAPGSGARQVFRRIIDKKTGKRVARGPLERLGGPTPFGVLTGKPGMLKKVTKQLSKHYIKVLKRKVDSFLKASRSG